MRAKLQTRFMAISLVLAGGLLAAWAVTALTDNFVHLAWRYDFHTLIEDGEFFACDHRENLVFIEIADDPTLMPRPTGKQWVSVPGFAWFRLDFEESTVWSLRVSLLYPAVALLVIAGLLRHFSRRDDSPQIPGTDEAIADQALPEGA